MTEKPTLCILATIRPDDPSGIAASTETHGMNLDAESAPYLIAAFASALWSAFRQVMEHHEFLHSLLDGSFLPAEDIQNHVQVRPAADRLELTDAGEEACDG